MHKVFQNFIDLLSGAEDSEDFSKALMAIASSFDLSCFAYLALPHEFDGKPLLLSTYSPQWTSHYLRNNYQRIDPVVKDALRSAEPFRWGHHIPLRAYSSAQRQLFDEARNFGIRFGFTIPIHDGHGPVAALTFASDERNVHFDDCIHSHARLLQLMAMYFHAHARRKLRTERRVEGIRLSRRELECLEWASRGKSAWEIGCILGISRNTVAYYLENAKEKLGVRTVVQAVLRLAAADRERKK